ncbi:MAG: SocA family protein [Methylobacteriaceae bacterium]|jgi:uncharacterized phage-associated protein|nr:SocA family protein [Methylobacteriaceae bacterium]
MAIRFTMNRQKATEAVLWIIQRGEPNPYNILKILFSAEKYHLNHYGRPITGDRYIAMEHGTVPSAIYDDIKNGRNPDYFKEGELLKATRAPSTDYFSDTDMEALEFGFSEYAGKPFDDVKNRNHLEPAWIKAFENNPNSGIAFEDMIEEDWLRRDLETTAPSIVL